MNENIPFINLKLPKWPLKSNFIFPIIPKNKLFYHLLIPADNILNNKILEILNEINLKPYFAILFYKKFGFNGPCHVDCHYYKNQWIRIIAGLNYNLFQTDSEMRWFKPESEKIIYPNPSMTQHWLNLVNFDTENFKPGSIFFNEKYSDPYATTSLKYPSLVRTDIVHDIKNSNITDRWSLSIRFDIYNQLQWNEYIDRFKNYIL